MVSVMKDLQWVLRSLSDAEYADVRYIEQSGMEVASRTESSDVFERLSERVVCRAVSGGYGIASSDRLDEDSLVRISKLALRQAKAVKRRVELKPVEAEGGRTEHKVEREFDVSRALELIGSIRDQLLSTLGEAYSRSELVLSFYNTISTLNTSDGVDVGESTPTIDLVLYLMAKRVRQGFASRILGGRGGVRGN